MITVRPEQDEDDPAIHDLIAAAFGREDEARLVRDLRRSGEFVPELSLVAVEGGEVVGHVLFSPMVIQTAEGSVDALALAPLAVWPDRQRRGVGTRLVEEGLKRCRELGHAIVVVIGHPAYYPRFGFSPARAKGLEAPFAVPDAAFMALELVPGALNGIKGLVKYPSPFDKL